MARHDAAQVGGLGDVVSGLAKACMERGHNVSIIMPYYQCLDEKQVWVDRCWESKGEWERVPQPINW